MGPFLAKIFSKSVRKSTDKEEEDSGKKGCVLEGPRIRKLLMKVTGKRIPMNIPNTSAAMATLFGQKQKNNKPNKLDKVDARHVNDPEHEKPNVYAFTKRQDGKCKTSYVGIALRDTVIRARENKKERPQQCASDHDAGIAAQVQAVQHAEHLRRAWQWS